MKRVWAYYRVSTRSQVLHHDTTLQQKACLNYISNFRDWKLEREIEELAVSGYSVKLEDRTGINRILTGARRREFQVLLVFMLDRIGRKVEEMKIFFEALKKENIEIWSVTEGEICNFSEQEAEYYLQCSKEVEKTSQRVKRRFEQLNEEGIFTGGSPPFGYQLLKNSGKSELAKTDKEAEVVKIIFDLAGNLQFGCSKISQELNLRGISTRKGKQWISSTITRILRNPIYIGYPACSKSSRLVGKHKCSDWKLQPKNEKLIIVDEEVFNKTQDLIEKRKPYENYSREKVKNTFLLSDLVYCGYCGRKLKAENNKNRPKSGKSSEAKIYRRYVCEHAKNKHEVHDQRDFGADKHELLISTIIFESIKKLPFLIDKKGIIQEKEFCIRKTESIKEQLNQLYSNYYRLGQENKFLSNSTLEKELLFLNKKLLIEETSLAGFQKREKSIELLIEELPNWERKYDVCTQDEKREMLGRIIKKVILKKGSLEIVTKEYVLMPNHIVHQDNLKGLRKNWIMQP